MQVIGIIIDLLGLIIDFQFMKKVTEKDIEDNMKKLKKYFWFQDYLKDEQYRELIIYNEKARHRIGKLRQKSWMMIITV